MEYIKLIRPKHWLKNFLIFLPLIFSGNFFNLDKTKTVINGFIIYCLIAGLIYIFNDIKDVEKDRKHKIKKNRPIASGKVSIKNAIIEFIIITILIIVLIYISKLPIVAIVLCIIYFLINFGYSMGLKNVPLVDIMILVSGFVIRVLFGASIIKIQVSKWLYLTIMSISFYLGLGKRRNEIIKNGSKTRRVLEYYNKDFLDKNMYMFLCMAIVFYSLWATDVNNSKLLIYTIPFVIFLSMKYSMNVEKEGYADPVETLLSDKVIIILGIILAILFFIILYI